MISVSNKSNRIIVHFGHFCKGQCSHTKAIIITHLATQMCKVPVSSITFIADSVREECLCDEHWRGEEFTPKHMTFEQGQNREKSWADDPAAAKLSLIHCSSWLQGPSALEKQVSDYFLRTSSSQMDAHCQWDPKGILSSPHPSQRQPRSLQKCSRLKSIASLMSSAALRMHGMCV